MDYEKKLFVGNIYICYWNDTDDITLDVILDEHGRPWFPLLSLATLFRDINDAMDTSHGKLLEGTADERMEIHLKDISAILDFVPARQRREFNSEYYEVTIDEDALLLILGDVYSFGDLYYCRRVRWWLVSKVLPVITADWQRRQSMYADHHQ